MKIPTPVKAAIILSTAPGVVALVIIWFGLFLIMVVYGRGGPYGVNADSAKIVGNAIELILVWIWALFGFLGLLGYLRWALTIFPRGFRGLANRNTGILLTLGILAYTPILVATAFSTQDSIGVKLYLATVYALGILMAAEMLLPSINFVPQH